MVNEKKLEQEHLREVVKTIGRALKREFEIQGKDVPDHIRQLLDQLEAKGTPKKEE